MDQTARTLGHSGEYLLWSAHGLHPPSEKASDRADTGHGACGAAVAPREEFETVVRPAVWGILRAHWVLVVMDQCTRRIVGFAVHGGALDGAGLCRMFNIRAA